VLREVDRQDHLVATNGTVLLAVELRSLACVQLEAQDGRSVPRLLYLAAVQVSAGDSARGSQRRRFYRPPQLKSVHGLWPAVTLAGSIDRDVASHVCPTQRGLGSEVGLSAWDLDRWGGLRALTSKFEGP
jgi:hypothetical protein